MGPNTHKDAYYSPTYHLSFITFHFIVVIGLLITMKGLNNNTVLDIFLTDEVNCK